MKEKLSKLIEALNHGLVERKAEIQLSLITMLAQENLILIGPPGTAKSEISRRLSQVIKDVDYYEYLLTKFTTPEEVFGPLSIKDLKNGVFKRNTQGYIPTAGVVFLDEIFKANSAILNSLLTIINERVYHNGSQKEAVPLLSLISASNELPIGDSELEALYDRFLVRKYVDYVSDDNLDELFNISSQPFKLDEDLKLTVEEIKTIMRQAQEVTIPKPVISAIKNIRLKLKEEFKDNLDEGFSDRRLVKIQKLLKVAAYTNGRVSVGISDVMLLGHCLWNNPENREVVSKVVAKEILITNDKFYEMDT